MEDNKIPLCKVCGQEPVVLKRKDKTPMNHGMCKKCLSASTSAGRKRNKEHPELRKPKSFRKSKCDSCSYYEDSENPNIVKVDFTGYESLLTEIEERQKTEIRQNPGTQILWELSKVFKDKDNPDVSST